MAFEENEYIYLVDQNGSKHWLRVAYSMIKVPSLGTIDGNRFKKLDDGSLMTIAGKEFNVFRPGTKELMESLERGTQIIIPKDASTILMYNDIKSGDRILEVGAGSGALTIALLRAVAPTGHVHTLEFREEHAANARRNIKRAGLEDAWTCQIGDARNAKVKDYIADTLFMDMPDPELAIDNLSPFLRPGGRVCAYIPNVNQMEIIVKALRKRGYCDVYALENIQREMEVHPGGVRPAYQMLSHTAYLVFGRNRGE